ncbi:hypothetical protein [Flavobacterium sp. 5]|uniref:hypothetical protein n=1 Tax=Flavobacterium sp. 5 TaxID=2035199 RepID=UPI000CA745C8|nr:hypothetical protein [Flavobacterium sp. 5]PKB18363.1 hypothetical protein CLU82_3638 [Flavobacterium sp. 5]
MMERHVFIKLRVANKDDFSTELGQKKIGTIYFEQSVKGAIQMTVKYFTEKTNLDTFRELYTHSQIFVPVGLFDEMKVEVIEEKQNEPQQQLQL